MRLLLVLLLFSSSCYSEIIEIQNPDEYHQIINSSPKALVFLTATYCVPCKTTRAAIDAEIAGEYPDVPMVIVDIDKNRQVADSYGIKGLPNIFVFKNGQKVAGRQGGLHSSHLRKLLAKLD